MKREDLRVQDEDVLDEYRPVTDAELADMGLMQRPVCGDCEGGTYCATHNQAGVDDWMYEGDIRVPNCRLSTENLETELADLLDALDQDETP